MLQLCAAALRTATQAATFRAAPALANQLTTQTISTALQVPFPAQSALALARGTERTPMQARAMATVAQKTHASCKKRFRVTGSGDIKRVSTAV